MKVSTGKKSKSRSINTLRERLGCEWPAIAKGDADAEGQRQAIWRVLSSGRGKLLSDDLSIVVFGSLARGEWTTGSDVDWTLLIDGQADPQHLKTAQCDLTKRYGVF